MKKYIFWETYSSKLVASIFKDLESNPDVEIVYSTFPPKLFNGVVRSAITRLSRCDLCQRILYLIFCINDPLKKIVIKDVPYYLVLTNSSSNGISLHYLNNYLEKNTNCIPIMLFLDDYDRYASKYARMLVEKIPQFRCMTFDPLDAEKYKFRYTMSVYSDPNIQYDAIEYDIYFSFIGLDRINVVQEMVNILEQSKIIKYYFWIFDLKKNKKFVENNYRGIYFVSTQKTYEDILDEVKKTNCILEVLHEDQHGVTLRYYEAICCNKKLLTNNKNVVNLPFYNADYIKVFDSFRDIDFEWIRRREKVNYGYDGRFSPNRLMDDIAEWVMNGN